MDVSFGDWMRAARVEKGVQQKEVAAALLLTPQYIHDVEAGRRDMSSPVHVMAWARFVGVDEQEALVRAAWSHPIVSHFLMYMKDAPQVPSAIDPGDYDDEGGKATGW